MRAPLAWVLGSAGLSGAAGALGLVALPARGLAATRPAPRPTLAAWRPRCPAAWRACRSAPRATRPQARTEGGIPLLVLGDAIEWTALVGIPLAAAPGRGPHHGAQGEDGAERRDRLHDRAQAIQRAAPEGGAGHGRPVARGPGALRARARAPGDGDGDLQRTRCRHDAAACACRCRAGAPVPSACAASSTASRAIRTAAWTSRPAPARRCWRRCRAA